MFIHAYRVPVEMEPKKWSNQAAFVLLVCSSPERPIIWRKDVEVKNSGLYLESQHLRRRWGSALVYQLIGVWMPVSFIEQSGQGGEEVK